MSDFLLVGTAVSRKNSVGTLYRSTPDGDWAPVKGIPQNTGVQAICQHPLDKDLIFAATCGGVYKSADAGQNWVLLNLPDSGDREFWSVSVHPQSPNVVFAGSSPVGVYRSDDFGDSWIFCGEPVAENGGQYEEHFKLPWPSGRSRLMRFAFDPKNPDLIFGAVEINGFIVSEDGGLNWHDASSELIKMAEDPKLKNQIVSDKDYEGMLDGHAVCTSAAAPGTAFYACRVGVFATDDMGKSWRNLNVADFAPIDYGRDIWVSVDDPNCIYTALSLSSRAEGESVGALYKSCDLGQTWQRADLGMSPNSTVMGMGVHVSNPNKLIDVTRGGQVFWTLDQGASWCEKQLPPNAGDAYCAAIL